MSKTLYFDCFSGASGDMVLGALLDLGLPLEALRGALGSLAIDYGGVSSERVLRAGVSAVKFHAHADASSSATERRGADGDDREGRAAAGHVHTHEAHAHTHEPLAHTHEHTHDGAAHTHEHDHDGHAHSHAHGHSHVKDARVTHAAPAHRAAHDHHSLKEIAVYIGRSGLSVEGKARAQHLFERLAEAEAAIHQMPVERVHLHEVGAVDSIIDIVGAVYGLGWLGTDSIMSSPLNVGSGTVECAHGTFPVPAPATARLLTGVPVYAGTIAKELVTPTGALIVSDYASSFGPLPAMTLTSIGYGAGARDFKGNPNVLRLFLGDAAPLSAVEHVVTIECEIDDMNPQLFGPLMDSLADAGALDVFYSAVQMKKNRPGTLVTVIAHPERREAIAGLLFAETTTIGVRYQEMRRDRLEREIRAVDTPLGPIRFKVASRGDRVLNAAAEFDDCARVAAAHQMPIKDVQAIATRAWLESRD